MYIWISIILQIAVLAAAYYYIFLFFKGTRGAQVLIGLILLLAVLVGITEVFNFGELNYILRRFSVYVSIALLVIFQPEIRRALAELGRQPTFAASSLRRNTIEHVVEASLSLAEHRLGALIAIERDIGTRAIQETGIELNAIVAPELLSTIFFPHTPLHDGGVIISGNKIMAAGCIFPLSRNTELQKNLGTRHRAAVGLSEETDAVIVIVSEETGNISVSYRGRLSRGLDEDRLRRFLTALLIKRKPSSSPWKRVQEKLDLTPEGIAESENRTTQENTNV
ncbi:MAG: diadenylate cyclase CdaA [Kiritimatiellae bacterium]|nr:diadenylate cyclase CdaA [Kiritimatiellia bacterium]